MRGGIIPEHVQIGMTLEEGLRIGDVLRELREQERLDGAYRLNLNEAEDEAIEELVKRLTKE